jgi:molecular chaperone DnaK
MIRALGIDLGTSYSTAGVVVDGRLEMVGLGAHSSAIPSAVFRGDDVMSVGDAAMVQGDAHPARLAFEFKRHFGESVPILVGDEFVTAEQLHATLGAWVFARACEREGSVPWEVVFTFPAFWGAFRRDAFLSLAREVVKGRAPVSLVTEPEAAAAFYASRDRLPADARVGVYDFGGGTFDASILRRTEDGFEVLGRPAGDDQLGGVDVDWALFRYVAERAGLRKEDLDGGDPRRARDLLQLRRNVTVAKELLSEQPRADLDVAVDGKATTIRVTRRELETVAEPLIDRTLDVFEQALGYASVRPGDLHSILLVGGASRMPRVAEALGERWHVPIALDSHPKFAVCLGAALWALRGQTQSTPAVFAPPGEVWATEVPESLPPPPANLRPPRPARPRRTLVVAGALAAVAAVIAVSAVALRSSGSSGASATTTSTPATAASAPTSAPATAPADPPTTAATVAPPTVPAPQLVRIDANPATLTLKPGQSEPIALAGTTDAGTPADGSLLTPVAWATDNAAVVSVIDGTATGVAPGTATITATVGTISVQVSITVPSPPRTTPPPPRATNPGSSGGTGDRPVVTPAPATPPTYVDPP